MRNDKVETFDFKGLVDAFDDARGHTPGLSKWAWGRAGVSLPHFAASQYATTPHVTRDQIQPGDLIFYGAPIGHVAIYIGNGQYIHAPRTGDVVRTGTVDWSTVVGISRPG